MRVSYPSLACLAALLTAVSPTLAETYQNTWSYTYDENGLADGVEDMAIDADGNVIVTGEVSVEPIFGGDMVTIKLDPDGNVLWTAS